MNRDQIVQVLQQRLGNRTQLAPVIVTELAIQQTTTLERNGRIVPWFLSSEIATATIPANEDRIPVPLKFIRETEDGGLFRFAEGAREPWHELEKKDFEDMLFLFQDAPAAPETYALSGAYFRVRPVPDQDYVMKLLYVKGEPTLDTPESENAWTRYALDLLLAVVGEVVAQQYIQDLELAQTFTTQIDRAWDRVHVDTESHANTNRSYQMGARP